MHTRIKRRTYHGTLRGDRRLFMHVRHGVSGVKTLTGINFVDERAGVCCRDENSAQNSVRKTCITHCLHRARRLESRLEMTVRT
jgi:hypothetical protein